MSARILSFGDPHQHQFVSQKSDRRQAREAVAAYHEAELAELVADVAEAIDWFRSGELRAFDVDEVVFQYSRAGKELWKFCNIGNVQVAADQCRELRRSTGGNAGTETRKTSRRRSTDQRTRVTARAHSAECRCWVGSDLALVVIQRCGLVLRLRPRGFGCHPDERRCRATERRAGDQSATVR